VAEASRRDTSWQWHDSTRTVTVMWQEQGGTRLFVLTLTEAEARALYADLGRWLEGTPKGGGCLG
jgi:hypothetical protein